MSDRAAAEKKAKDDKKARELTKTVETVVAGDEAFKVDDKWKPWWTTFKFDDNACLKKGEGTDGFFVPAGTILPLGASIPKATVLRYGGYFPEGTSFPMGVQVPLHARMVNVLPEETKDIPKVIPEGLCVVQ